ncbi:hypothetical protein GCU56_17380 [Geodermatophilus sabuli]|uniref:Uncharacterized protein n=1 Tax=Geodermatophilus sabuli TaxID=1564158 RepID=A0A7K3W4B9_9ACTN|nr:hypothetical protein [Geodermatophilus sabuli]NEK59632.1 hypothetical protein [Geodermatophilus sabuli]
MSLLVSLIALVLLAAAAVAVGLGRRPPPSPEATVTAARRHAGLGSAAAVGCGLAAALAVGTTRLGDPSAGSLGVTALLVPIAFGVVHTLVLGAAELTWPRPEGPVRRARLVRRGLLDAAPRWLLRLAVGATGLVVLTVGVGAGLADPDGRSYTVAAGPIEATASPFPGLLYGRPAVLGLLVLAAAVVAALWVVANRPAVATEDARAESALRRASVHRVLRGATATALVVAGGLLAVGGNAAWSVASTTGSGTTAAGGVVAAVAGGTALLAGLLLTAVRAPAVPVDAPAVPAG